MDEVLGTPSGKLSSCSGGVPARLLVIGAVIGTSAGTQRAWSQTGDVFVQKMLMAKPSGILRWRMGQTCRDREGQWHQGDGGKGSERVVGWGRTVEHPGRIQVGIFS